MNDLEVRQLRYFVAVAEELHFGRAAGRLGMAQPPLSRAIRDLERQLGVALLERTTRQVRLTAAGEVLLRDARTALEAVTAAARRAREAGSPSPRLRVALKADVDGGLLPQILDAYCADDAALPPELVLGGIGEQPQALRDGRADVGLLLCPFDDRGLDSEPLLTEPLLVALAAADPLAARTRLCLADLAGRRLPGGSPASHGRPAGPRRAGPAPDRQPDLPGEHKSPSGARGRPRTWQRSSVSSRRAASCSSRLPRWPGATRDPGSPTGRSATSRTPRWPWPGPRTRARRPSPPSCAPPARSQPPRTHEQNP